MAGHGSRPLRGLESTGQSSAGTAKFGRLFRWLEPAAAPLNPMQEQELRDTLAELAGLMVTSEFQNNVKDGKSPDAPITEREPDDESPDIPAGYTYLGQFIDHDVTFDPASSLQRMNDPDALEDFRTPRLDLDCLYGRGPSDQPYLYEKPSRGKFILGPDVGVQGMHRPDLQRTGDRTALIGDKRNDENKIVAQIQALFLRFHNKVYDKLAPGFKPGEGDAHFNETQRIVRWCYQWIVLNDFLPRVCDPRIVESLMPLPGERTPRLQFYQPHGGTAYIPVEFSVAAYRFGHSMVRPSYSLNDNVLSGTSHFNGTPFARIPIFPFPSRNPQTGQPLPRQATDSMAGFGEALPAAWGIDWHFFFGTPNTHAPGSQQIPQPSYRIDASLVDPLLDLPEFATEPTPFRSLAFRNLQRGVSMGLPSGQGVARMMGVEHDRILNDEQLWTVCSKGEEIQPWAEGADFFAKDRSQRWLSGAAPLWYYILKEAEVMNHGRHLGDVGSRIVAETLIGLAWHDHYSYLFQMPRWDPSQELLGLPARPDMLALTQWIDAP
ncbi:MAG TPA: heme peroxidase family protein [Roseateles sp.]|uniref:peroxidase family protein n=1 Tax=Roseateles sp. TaxID=1971397 RepID=UPI002ED96D22